MGSSHPYRAPADAESAATTSGYRPFYEDDSVTLWHGDCLDVMRTLPDCSVDAVVTDPPYALNFMGRKWDRFDNGEPFSCEECGNDDATSGYRLCLDCLEKADEEDLRGAAMLGQQSQNWHAKATHSRGYADNNNAAFGRWCRLWTAECLRVLKPGGYLLAFGGTRTWHRLACAVEDAGFEVRDSIAWLYGSGFPKSLDVSKALDKTAGHWRGRAGGVESGNSSMSGVNYERTDKGEPVTPAAAAAAAAGWGTALKPAFEPVVVARKPLIGTVAQNWLTHGTGALNIDGCRIGKPDGFGGGRKASSGFVDGYEADGFVASDKGRWPANVVLDASQAAELDKQSGWTEAPAERRVRKPNDSASSSMAGAMGPTDGIYAGGSGGASRFFYVAKAPQDERPSYVAEDAGTGRVTGLGGKVRQCNVCETRAIASGAGEPSCGHGDYRWEDPTSDSSRVAHPTVKPLSLMRWLVRLVTPPGGTVLEPFAGSGTTAEACVIEGFQCVAIEREATYLPLIVARLSKPIPLDLFGGAA